MKKEKRNFIYIMTTIGIALIVMLVIVTSFPKYIWFTTNQYCGLHPEKCVCEDIEGKAYSNDLTLCKQGTKGLQFRLKTQAELDIDCNNNPREDEKCKCLSNQYERFYFVYNQKRLKESKISFKDFAHITYLDLNNTRIDCSRNWTEDCFVYELVAQPEPCEESRPKTECEKGMGGWIEETIPLAFHCQSDTFKNSVDAFFTKNGEYSKTWETKLYINLCEKQCKDCEKECYYTDCFGENAGKPSCLKEFYIQEQTRFYFLDKDNDSCQIEYQTVCQEAI